MTRRNFERRRPIRREPWWIDGGPRPRPEPPAQAYTRTHPDKPYGCPEAGCNTRFTHPAKMRTHLMGAQDAGGHEWLQERVDALLGPAKPARAARKASAAGEAAADAADAKPYVCPRCGTRCTRASDLRRHLTGLSWPGHAWAEARARAEADRQTRRLAGRG